MSFKRLSESRGSYVEVLRQLNEEMFKRNVLTDVECIVEGQVFEVHRTLLAAFSPYLKKKLLDDNGSPTGNKVHLSGIGSSEFEILLQYMYNGKLEVDCNNIYEVIKAASILEMQDAMQDCLQLIARKGDIKTYFYSYVLSKKMGVVSNWQKALKLITHRFEETAFTEEFMQLDLEYVLEILSAQEIGARSEAVVFLAALKWLNQDYENRVDHAISVMGCVRFSCMCIEEILACFHPPFLPQVVNIPEVQMMLYKATCYILAKSHGQEEKFKEYASPKRRLTVEKLPMKLWHNEPSHSINIMDSQWPYSSTSTEYYAESRFRESLKKDMIDSDNEDPEIAELTHLINSKMKKHDLYSKY